MDGLEQKLRGKPGGQGLQADQNVSEDPASLQAEPEGPCEKVVSERPEQALAESIMAAMGV